jgi:hypothetical protein
MLLSLALDLFGQIFIKIMNHGGKKGKAQSFIHAAIMGAFEEDRINENTGNTHNGLDQTSCSQPA